MFPWPFPYEVYCLSCLSGGVPVLCCFVFAFVVEPLCHVRNAFLLAETAVVRALWGATRVSRAKEIVFTVLSKGHCVSPIMHT